MTENNVRKDFFERRFAKLGSRYIGKMLDLSLMLGASVVIVAVYYLAAVANLPTFRVILVTFQITFASLFVNLVGMPLYNRVITRKSSAKLAAQEKGQILLEDTEEEHKAWEEVNFYVGRISVGTFFMGMINALGSVLVVMILAGTEPIVLFHTFIAGTIASTGVAIQNMLFMDRALAPVRAALLPSQINWQTARLGLHLRTRLLAVFGAIVVIVFLVLGPLGYQKILDATVPGANPEAILQNMGVQLIGLGMAAIVISFLLAFTAERAIVQPLEDIINTMNKVESGDLTARTEVISSGELGQVSLRLNQVIRQIEGAQAILEQRIAERTRNLELAAEVGRTVSQVRALDVMLKDAAELIRKQFDLYYVQVYLTDPSQTNLILQSGTGAVGAELVGRGHRLPLDTASITGRAAIEKKSVVISNTAASPTFRPNPLLPDTRSEMAVPLLIGERVVGVLDMQSEHAGSLSTDILTAFEALAGQLAIAIQNANFLAETQQARTEVEAQARRLTHANWIDYQDAIHQPEESGFVFEQNKIAPLTGKEQVKDNALVASITVTGEALGNLVVEMEGGSPIARTEELVNTVAQQVARQIESLRLLDSAERYRFEAEGASRRLTREGWKDYTDANIGGNLSFIYDLKEVRPLKAGDTQAEESAFSLPLKVRDETIGKLVVQGLEADDKESLDLANAVAERLGAHIESLRQFDQTQSALAQSEKLSVASMRFAQSADLQELLAVANETLDIPVVNRALLGVFNYSSANELESMDIAANWWNGNGHEPSEIGRHYSIETLNVLPLFMSATPVFSDDTFHDERVNGAALELVTQQNIRSMAVLPLYLGGRQVGVLFLESEETHNFTQSDTRLFAAIAPQIATVLENRRQFERAQKQAERESTLNIISQKIQSATTVEAVLQIAARELGHALGAPMTIAQLSMKDKK